MQCKEGEVGVGFGSFVLLVLTTIIATGGFFVVFLKRFQKRIMKKMRKTPKSWGLGKVQEAIAKKKLIQMQKEGKVAPSANANYPWEINVKKIKFKTKIGAGNFGEVWIADLYGTHVAVKTVIPGISNNEEFKARFMEEIQMMSELHHPNVVLFLGACIVEPRVCLVLEFCIHGDLLSFLQSENRHNIQISMHMMLKMALDVARGINYLHQKKNIIQRDIKSRNILVDENLNGKVADFGLSRLKEEDAGMTACGTPAWTAPEVVRMENYTEKIDVYSFAIVLWELVMRDEPYSGEGGIQIAYAAAEQGLRPDIPDHIPRPYAQLMKECWADSPDDRPGFGQILTRLFGMMKAEGNKKTACKFYFGKKSPPLKDVDYSEFFTKEEMAEHGLKDGRESTDSSSTTPPEGSPSLEQRHKDNVDVLDKKVFGKEDAKDVWEEKKDS